jgi:hypothetical protein
MQEEECKVCLLEHDEEIHTATLRVREWLRERVTRFFPVDETDTAVDAA